MSAGRLSRRLLLVSVAVLGVAVGSARTAQSNSTTILTRDVVHNLSLASPLGAVPATQQVTVGVYLTNPNQAAEDAYAKTLYDPSSANYENFLDPGTFDAQYGVPASAAAAATSWLQGQGFSVSQPEGSTSYLLASGTESQVAAAFHTSLANYSYNGRTFYANSAAPTVPSTLGIGTVLGLNNYNRLFTPRVSAPTKTGATTGPAGVAVPNTGLLSPKDLWSIYDLPSTNMGNGQSMAILGWGVTDPVIPDLRNFEAEWGLPQVPISVKLYGDTSTPDTSGDGATGEWELDTQASTGMAPDVKSETLYFAHHNTDADSLAAIAGWVNDNNGPTQASASWGECENVGNANAVLADGMEVPGDKLLEQAVIEGRTLFSSTGDTGSSCPVLPEDTNGLATQGYPGLEWPSVSPWAVAVGGTDLTSDGNTPPKRFTETAWEYTGGGNSTSEPAGSYQVGVAPTNCAFDQNGNPYVPGVGAAGPVCRSTPDVAALSGDVATGNGMLITNDSGADQQGAGTSLSSPLWLGFWTRIQAAAKDKGLGFANYSIYKLAGASQGRDFYDVTVGDNQPYPAKPGYDNASGWGTPEVSQIMLDLTGRLTPTHNDAAAPVATTPTTTCGSLFSDPTGDESYSVEGNVLSGPGTLPQLDITGGKMLLSADGTTLRTIITVRNLSTTIPTGGVENDYNMVFTLGGTQYFTQLAVDPDGVVTAYDGELLHVSLESRYQQLHVDTGTITPGPNGTVEVDVPLANLTGATTGADFHGPSAASYVREGAVAGPLEPVDSAGPTDDYILGGC